MSLLTMPKCHWSVSCYVIVLLLTSLPHQSRSCFPVKDVFDDRLNWIQAIDLDSRYIISVGAEDDDTMNIATEGLVKHTKMTVHCLIAYGDNRYLVKIDQQGRSIKYQCLQFTSLSPGVVRQGRTKASVSRKKVHCTNHAYEQDEAVLVAYVLQTPQPCPLSGGYQLIMHQGMAIAGHCEDSIQTYNPHIQFQCDNQDTGNVLVDFGKDCVPPALGQTMLARQLTHLECMGHWTEGGFTSLLLRMRDFTHVYWCLHYKPVAHSRISMATSDTEEFWSFFLTLDGRCSSQAFGSEDVPRNTSMFGFLASYRPENDPKCKEEAYLDNCALNQDKCFESTSCPANCGRCKQVLTTLNCSFPADALGKWAAVDSRRKLELTVENNRIKGSSFGEFICRGPAESGLPKSTYPVVQTGASSTCMPFYSCVQIHSPAQGVLIFRIRSSVRDSNTGKTLSCRETENRVGYVVPRPAEEIVTLVNKDKLEKVSCEVMLKSTYPTLLDECRFALDECSDDCEVLEAGYDVETCGNRTAFHLDTKHECLAIIDFQDGMRGILTKSQTRGRYLCWLFLNTRLFVATPQECNQPSVTRILNDPEAHIAHDPLNAISLPISASGGNFATKTVPSTDMFIYLLIMGRFFQLVISAF